MALITFPSTLQGAASIQWWLASNTQASTSPIDGTVQTVEMLGAKWMCSLAWEILTETQARQMMAFLVQMRGRANRVLFGPPHRKTPAGTISGSCLVNGPGQTGASLTIDTFTGTLLVGDYIHFDVAPSYRSLHMVVADRSGPGACSIEPPIRNSPADNAVVTYTSPNCIMRLLDDEQAMESLNYSIQYGYSVTFVETYKL